MNKIQQLFGGLVPPYTCPLSGNVQELSVYGSSTGTVKIRLGIYSSLGVLVGEGTSAVSLTAADSSDIWRGHMTQDSVKAAGGVSPCVLVAGQQYYLVFCEDTDQFNIWYKLYGSPADQYYQTGTDYTAGMPTNLPAYYTWQGEEITIRCNVTSAATTQDSLFVNVGGTWNPIFAAYYYTGGQWDPVIEVQTYTGGSWQ